MFNKKNTLEKIDAEVQRLTSTISSLEARSAEKRKQRDRAESERDALVGALDDEGGQGMAALKAARERLREAHDECEEFDKRMLQLKAELQDLEPKRAEAYREQKRQELEARWEMFLREVGSLCEDAVAKRLQADAAVEQAAKELAALARECGRDSRPYESLQKAWRRSLQQRIEPRLLGDKRADVHRTLSAPEVFELYVKGKQESDSQTEERKTA